jgi:hypothetical protein
VGYANAFSLQTVQIPTADATLSGGENGRRGSRP